MALTRAIDDIKANDLSLAEYLAHYRRSRAGKKAYEQKIIFISAVSKDQDIADDIGSMLTNQGFEYDIGTLSDIEPLLNEYVGIIVVYNNSNVQWVINQLQVVRRQYLKRRYQPIPAALFNTMGEDKEAPLKAIPPNVRIIESTRLKWEEFSPFIDDVLKYSEAGIEPGRDVKDSDVPRSQKKSKKRTVLKTKKKKR